jgi:hypothetical protein
LCRVNSSTSDLDEEFDLFEMDENTRDEGDDDSENYDNHFTTRQGKKHLDIDLLHMAVSSALEVVHAIILALCNIFISASCWTIL